MKQVRSIKIAQRKGRQYRCVVAPVLNKFLTYGFVFFTLGLGVYGLLYPLINFQDPFHLRYDVLPRSMLFSHIVGAGVAIGVIPLQYYMAFRSRVLHRYLGCLYVLAVLVSSYGAYYMAAYALGGVSSTIALSILATLWWSSTLISIAYVMKGDVNRHYLWMIRSIALTASAITLRLMSPFIDFFFDEILTQQILYWSCWPINLLLAQIWLSRKGRLKLPQSLQWKVIVA